MQTKIERIDEIKFALNCIQTMYNSVKNKYCPFDRAKKIAGKYWNDFELSKTKIENFVHVQKYYHAIQFFELNKNTE